MSGTSAYKSDLRRNRTLFLEALKRKHGYHGRDLDQKYQRKMIAIQNETRGKLGELFGEISLTATGKGKEADIIRDKISFTTPFGGRRIDVWHGPTKTALEVKSGYACRSKFVRAQIKKDVWLRQTGRIAHIEWLLLQGGSKPLLDYLRRHKITVDIGWPEL